MTHGIDTDFVVACEIIEHPFHESAIRLRDRLLSEDHGFGLAPQTLAEFVHVVTDARRMPIPLTVDEASRRAEAWWSSREVLRVVPDGTAVPDFLAWLREHRLGRKRLLDTLLAATFRSHGISRIITNNRSDYHVLGGFEVFGYR